MALAPNIMNGEIACVHGIIVLLDRHVGIMVIMATCKTSYTFLTLYCSWLTFLAGETKCQKDASGEQSAHGALSPACDNTGGYTPLQCDPSSNSCWCVDRLGREIPRTRNNDTRRNCDEAGMKLSDSFGCSLEGISR